MIPTIYTKPSCASSRKAKKWFKDHGVDFTERNILKHPISIQEIKDILRITDNGVEDVISYRSNRYQELQMDLENLSFETVLQLIQKNPTLLRLPIVSADGKLQIGFNQEEIRKFLPKETRRKNLYNAQKFGIAFEY